MPATSHQSFRSQLRRIREEKARSHALITKDDRNTLPFCTTILQIVPVPRRYEVALQRVVDPTKCPGKMRVVYDRAILCTPSCYSIVIPLQFEPSDIIPGHLWKNHSIRVALVTNDRPQCVQFPPEIVRSFVNFALDKRSPGWHTELVQYGLVQKSWLHLLDVLYEVTGMGDPISCSAPWFAHLLAKRPEKVHLFRTLYFPWRHDNDDDAQQRRQDSLGKILEIAVASIQVVGWFESLPPPLVLPLSKLRNVEKFRLDGRPAGRLDCSLTMSEIQKLIRNWEKLRNVELIGWKNVEDGLDSQ